MKNEWQKVERITNEHLGWEVQIFEYPVAVGIVSGVGKFNFFFIDQDGRENWRDTKEKWYVRPPEPPKKKALERIIKAFQITGHPLDERIYDAFVVIGEILDEEFERREK